MVAEKKPAGIRLDIACGQAKEEGWTGIDRAGDADIVADLFAFPWPIADGSVSEVRCSHFVEHIPHYRPEWSKDGWWMFWDEVYRITEPGAEINVIHPYVMNGRAFWDPTHVRFIHEMSWYYLDAEWRKSQKLDHYDTTADFEVLVVTGTDISPDMAARSAEAQQFGRLHYWNVVGDLVVKLKRRG